MDDFDLLMGETQTFFDEGMDTTPEFEAAPDEGAAVFGEFDESDLAVHESFALWNPIIEAPEVPGWEQENEQMIAEQMRGADIPDWIVDEWEAYGWGDWIELDAEVSVYYEG